MNKTNVQQARARFDELDAEGVVTFLQEQEGGDGDNPFHRGYRRHTLAQLISMKKPIPMTLVVDVKANEGRFTAEQLLEFATDVMNKQKELEIEPIIYSANPVGDMLEAQFKWERSHTEIEEVAAKAYLRDNPTSKKIKWDMYNNPPSSSWATAAAISGGASSVAAEDLVFINGGRIADMDEVQAMQHAFAAGREPAPAVESPAVNAAQRLQAAAEALAVRHEDLVWEQVGQQWNDAIEVCNVQGEGD